MGKNVVRKGNLVTINTTDNRPLSLYESLFYLVISLNKSYRLHGRMFIESLCEISIQLHKDLNRGGINANKNLQEKYFLPNLRLPPSVTPNGIPNLLFTGNALRLLSLLLCCKSIPKFMLPSRTILAQNDSSLEYRIIESFLLANQILAYLHQDINDISNYYFVNNIFKPPLNIIIRSRILYNTSYFNKKIKQYLSMSSHELNNFLYLIYAHVYMNSPAKIEPDTNFHRFFGEDVCIQLKKILSSLSKSLKNESISYSVLQKNLSDYYILDRLENPLNRGKPFFKIGDRFVCMRPDQLADAFEAFPYFGILKQLEKKEEDEFFYEFGKISLERYLSIIGQDVFGNNWIKPSKKHENDPCSDGEIHINPTTHVLIEIKSARAEDKIKGGSEKILENKFVTILKSSNQKPRGIV